MKTDRPTGGYGYLKKKYEKLQANTQRLHDTIAEKDGIIDEQKSTITSLTNDLAASETKNLALQAKHEQQVEELFDHMGWFRRLLWEIKHATED